MTDERTLDEAMGMRPDEITQLRAKVERIAPERCAACYRSVPHTAPETAACPGGDS